MAITSNPSHCSEIYLDRSYPEPLAKQKSATNIKPPALPGDTYQPSEMADSVGMTAGGASPDALLARADEVIE